MRGADPRLVPGPGGPSLRRLLVFLLLACAVGLLLGSRPLAAWAARLPPGWDTAQDAATWWDGQMDRAALTAPYDEVHRRVREWAGP